MGAADDLDLHHREALNHARAHRSRVQAYSGVWDYDFAAPYGNAACPVLLMTAEDDVLYPHLARAKEMQPDAEVAPITGANFEPDLAPAALAKATAALIARCQIDT